MEGMSSMSIESVLASVQTAVRPGVALYKQYVGYLSDDSHLPLEVYIPHVITIRRTRISMRELMAYIDA